MLRTVINCTGTMIIFGAFMAMAGAAGDCDGKCGPGNDIGTMLTIMGQAAMVIMVTGFILMLVNARR